MKPLLLDFLGDETNPFRRKNMLREFLQARTLLALQDDGAFSSWAFVGGTALRFLYHLPRYSEDLDFSVHGFAQETKFERHIKTLKKRLTDEVYDVDVKLRTHATVAAAQVRFRGLLYETGISPHRDEVFMIKIEIDTNPPAGAVTETRIVRRFVLLNLFHYDKASLLAGKLHAILSRTYTKGRDLYDLAWYLADDRWPEPNLAQLNNALCQTGWEGEAASSANWRELVARKLATLNWADARRDVAPFLEREQDLDLISESSLLGLLRQSR